MTRNHSEGRNKGKQHHLKVLKRDDYKCVVCGADEKLEVHHMKALVYGGESSMDNLTTLCSECHRYAPVDGIESNKRFSESRNKFVYEEMIKSPDINQMVTVAYVELLKSKIDEYIKNGFVTKENAEKILAYEQNKLF